VLEFFPAHAYESLMVHSFQHHCGPLRSYSLLCPLGSVPPNRFTHHSTFKKRLHLQRLPNKSECPEQRIPEKSSAATQE